MNHARLFIALACAFTVGGAGAARAGAPQPDQRQGDFTHLCQGGPNKGQTCTVATQAVDCPRSACVVQTVGPSLRGTLTIVAHDEVTDWLNGGVTNRALSVLLEVKAPDGSRQLLAATYQDVATPTDPPAAPGNVVAIAMDEFALRNAASAVGGLRFAQPEAALRQQLQALFGTTATPVLVAVDERRFEFADHTADSLASVLRFKVRIQFVEPL